MTIAKDVISDSGAQTVAPSWTHTPSGTPRGVFVGIVSRSNTDEVTGVTYGGVAMTRVDIVLTALSNLATYLYFLGSALPTGAQTVTVSATGSDKVAWAETMTAAGDCEIVAKGIFNEAAVNGDNTFQVAALGEEVLCSEVIGSGSGNPTRTHPLTDWTGQAVYDFGNTTATWFAYDIIGTADVTAGFNTDTTSIYGVIAATVKESGAPPPSNAPVIETQTVGIQGAAASDVTTNRPAGTVSQELLLFPHGTDGGTGVRTLTGPAGSTKVYQEQDAAGGVVSALYRLLTGSSEPATYTATSNEIERQVLIALRITGTDPTDAIDGWAWGEGSGAAISPDLTTVAADCRIIRIVAYDYSGGTLVEDAGYPADTTGLYVRGSNATGGAGATILGAAHSELATPGAVGTATWALSGMTSSNWAAFTVAVKPGTYVPPGPVATGDLQAEPTTMSGDARIAHRAEGTLQAELTTMTGQAHIAGVISASGDLQAEPTVMTGEARLRHRVEGTLQAELTTMTGSARIKEQIRAEGALQAELTVMSGTAHIRHRASGNLQAELTTMTGITIVGDGWTQVGTGGNETWTPVDTGS